MFDFTPEPPEFYVPRESRLVQADPVPCEPCNGTGFAYPNDLASWDKCPACGGEGEVQPS